MSEARATILAAVQAALADAPSAPAVSRPPGVSLPDVVTHFAERVADYRAIVERCAAADLDDRVQAALPDGARVVIPPGLGVDVPGAVVDDGLDAYALDAIDVVITRAAVAIAETGTIVLDHGPGQGRRIISLVPDRHICIVSAAQIVADVPDAMGLLDPARPLTWISGPSATSDIELDRVEGVHGPRQLHVLIDD